MKIAVTGLGYVGLSNAVLMVQKYRVVALDVAPQRVALINDHKSPIVDAEIEDFPINRTLDLTAVSDPVVAYKGVEVVVYEPALQDGEFFRSRVVNDLETFKSESDLIVANRLTDDIRDVAYKVFTRDLFGAD